MNAIKGRKYFSKVLCHIYGKLEEIYIYIKMNNMGKKSFDERTRVCVCVCVCVINFYLLASTEF